MARRLAKPLEQLEEAAGAVAHGHLAARSGLSGRADEIGSLGRSFDAMAADLERNDASRRRFFQDAAHEMKTPLAVIDASAAAGWMVFYEDDDRHLETIRSRPDCWDASSTTCGRSASPRPAHFRCASESVPLETSCHRSARRSPHGRKRPT